MPQFTVTRLFGDEFLVEGTDTNGVQSKVKLQSTPWAAVLEYRNVVAAQGEFDKEIDAFYGPLIEAKNRLFPADDKFSHVVLKEGVQGEESEGVDLDRAGVLLNLIDQGREDLLIWTGEHELGAVKE
jgi:hypothetical protein